ncbi:hypothetical protein [Brevibacillus sp. SYSU BS000544]|uniref:hypothetical protein n=1 Tax=Brevibacillus sp. SYSU BS000544 TaxID=3416443 RepID=UPI003CE5A9BB
MKYETVVKWLGMICLLAGIVRMGMTPTAYLWGTDSVQELTFGFIACILMSAGTIVFFLVQSKETGVIGFISTLGMIVGNIITTGMVWTILALGSVPETENMVVTITRTVMMVSFMVGTLVFTIVSFRAKVFPRWIVFLFVLMLGSMALPLDDNKWFAFFWGLAYVGFGYCVWAGKLGKQFATEVSAR